MKQVHESVRNSPTLRSPCPWSSCSACDACACGRTSRSGTVVFVVTLLRRSRSCRRRAPRRVTRSYHSVATVGNLAEMCMREVACLFAGVSRETSSYRARRRRQRPSSGRTSWTISAASRAIVLPLSAFNVFRRVPSALLIVPLDAQHASPFPSGRSGTPSSETAQD